MTTTIQIPEDRGGTNVPYNDGTGPYGMAASNGYGYAQHWFPLLSEYMAMLASYWEDMAPIEGVVDEIAAIGANIDSVNIVAADIANVITVAAAIANVNAVGASIDNVNAVFLHLDAIDTLAPHVSEIDTVAGSILDVNTVASGITAVSTVSTNIAAVQTAATNIGAIQAAPTQAAAAAASAAAANGSMLTATAQASLAAGYAASAGSVAQQDLSGVTAAALHRSPNAVVAMCDMDTSQDSNPGWPAQCDNLSYLSEGLNGKWLGPCASESAARSVSGAATGDYFQLTTDGKFYKLNTTSGTTEVFRGNKARPPRLGKVVAEAFRVVIYDLLEPGRPMWMVFNTNGAAQATTTILTNTNNAVAYREGLLWVGCGTAGVRIIDFVRDRADMLTAGTSSLFNGSIAQRNIGLGYPNGSATGRYPVMGNGTVNAIVMTTMPDAPVDPVTGLQVPTVLVGTAGGLSLIQNDGTVRNSSSTNNFASVAINPYMLVAAASGGATLFCGLKPGALGASFALTTLSATAAPGFNPANAAILGVGLAGRSNITLRMAASMTVIRFNESNPAASIVAVIGKDSSAGMWAGDIRRAWGGDVVAGTLDGTDRITNGAWAGTTGWTPEGTATGISTSGGQLTGTTGPATNCLISQQITGLTIGATCVLEMPRVSGASGIYLNQVGGASSTYGGAGSILGPSSGPCVVQFTAPATSLWVNIMASGTNGSITVGAISMREGVADRSYKAHGIQARGALVRTAVASAAQLVAYSNFSASNYLREAYSADLDPVTGALWVTPGPVSIPAVLTPSMFPLLGSETSAADIGSAPWGAPSNGSVTGSTWSGMTNSSAISITGALTVGKYYRLRSTTAVSSGVFSFVAQGVGTIYSSAAGSKDVIFKATATGISLYASTAGSIQCTDFRFQEVGPAVIFDRSAATGAFYRIVVYPDGTLGAIAYDGTTTRTAVSAAAYNTGSFVKPALVYTPDGTLAINVNGVTAGSTAGTALGSLSNAAAVVTIGNSRTLDAAFPGSIALQAKVSMTAPTAEQSVFMWEQERQMLNPGAQITLADSGSLVGDTFDAQEQSYTVASATAKSKFAGGLVRVNSEAPSAGSFIGVSHSGGIKCLARSGTNPGVDISMPAQNLKEELQRRGEEAAARRTRPPQMRVYRATASQASFPLSVGDEVGKVFIGGLLMTEGSGDNYTVSFDGFKPTVSYPAGAALGAVVAVEVRRAA